MRQRNVIALSLLMAVGGVLVSLPSAPRKKASSTAAVPRPVEATLPTFRPIRAAATPKTGPRPCQQFADDILALDLQEMGYDGPQQTQDPDKLRALAQMFRAKPLGQGCGKIAETHPLHYLNFTYEMTCGKVPEITAENETKALGVVSHCLNLLYIFRLQALADAYASVPAAAIDDPKLIGLLMLGTPRLSPETWQSRYLELALRRRELTPQDPQAVAGVAKGAFNRLQEGTNGEAIAEMIRATDELERLAPNDVRVLENRLLVARAQKDFATMRSLAEEQVARGENVEEATFYLAQAQFLIGDKKGAQTEIAKLTKQDPRNSRWAQAAEALTRAPAGTPVEMIFADRNTVFSFEETDPFLRHP